MTRKNFALLQLLEKNIADEAEAREGYYRIFEQFGSELTSHEVEDLAEIIAEELKHSNILQEMIRRRTGIVAEG